MGPLQQSPPRHDSPARHARPQLPQLRASTFVSVQEPPQSASGAHPTQAPTSQSSPALQARPQVPQAVGSLVRSTHRPAQGLRPPAHEREHTPTLQNSPPAQGRSQPPQWAALELVSRQPSPHSVVVAGQVHALSVHVRPPVQALAHIPQCDGSLVRSTHRPSQGEVPTGQVSVQPLAPQTSPVAQAMPQVPQCAGLDPRSTHAPPQSESGGEQSTPPSISGPPSPPASKPCGGGGSDQPQATDPVETTSTTIEAKGSRRIHPIGRRSPAPR